MRVRVGQARGVIRRPILYCIIAMWVIAAGALVALLLARPRGPDPRLPDEGVAGAVLPAFTLTDQDGKPLTRDSLLGHYTIVDFIFTNCPFICPAMTGNMKMLQDDLRGTGVKFLSVSVDPAHDTPARLKAYAVEHGADPARWAFATGEFETVKAIVTGALHYDLEPDPGTPVKLADGTTMSNMRHPGYFTLIGPKGEALGMYRSSSPEDLKALADRVRAISPR